MRNLSTVTLLQLWEQGLHQRPVQQALLLLTAACPELTPAAVTQLTIGQRNRLLLQLRALTFGEQLAMQATCPHCASELEMACTVGDLFIDNTTAQPAIFAFDVDGYQIGYRLPTSLDLAALADCTAIAVARAQLLTRCLVAPHAADREGDGAQVPAEWRERLILQMQQNDPQADMQLTLVCPACGQGWQAAFDIVTFFWAEIAAWARRTLYDVHTLARAYGWREADILALSPQRRQFYLELQGAV